MRCSFYSAAFVLQIATISSAFSSSPAQVLSPAQIQELTLLKNACTVKMRKCFVDFFNLDLAFDAISALGLPVRHSPLDECTVCVRASENLWEGRLGKRLQDMNMSEPQPIGAVERDVIKSEATRLLMDAYRNDPQMLGLVPGLVKAFSSKIDYKHAPTAEHAVLQFNVIDRLNGLLQECSDVNVAVVALESIQETLSRRYSERSFFREILDQTANTIVALRGVPFFEKEETVSSESSSTNFYAHSYPVKQKSVLSSFESSKSSDELFKKQDEFDKSDPECEPHEFFLI